MRRSRASAAITTLGSGTGLHALARGGRRRSGAGRHPDGYRHGLAGIDAAAARGAVVESAGNVRVDGAAPTASMCTPNGDARVVSAGDLAASGIIPTPSTSMRMRMAWRPSECRPAVRPGQGGAGDRGRAYDRAVLDVDSRGDIAVEGAAGILLTAFGDGGVTLSSAGNVTVAGEGADGIAAGSQRERWRRQHCGAGSLATGITAAGINATIHSRGNVTLDGRPRSGSWPRRPVRRRGSRRWRAPAT